MQLFQLITQLLYPMLLMAVPCWTHWVKKHRKRGLKPYFLSVAFRPNARRFVETLCLIALLTLPALYMRSVGSALWVLPTIGIIFPFFCHRVAERALFKLTDVRHFYVAALVIFVCLYVPHLFPMAVTLATLMAAAMLYPSKELVDEVRHPSFVSEAVALRTAFREADKSISTTKLITYIYEIRNHSTKQSGD